MKQISVRIGWLLILFCICLPIVIDAQSRSLRKSQGNDDRLLRNAILKAENINKNNVLTTPLNYQSRRVDLNGDGQKEIAVWVPTADLGGTSGYPIIVFTRTAKGYQMLWEEAAWTPLVVLATKHKGWRDIAYQTGGGGAAWQFEVVRFNGRAYKYLRTQTARPKGQLIIDKNWKRTTFGPMPD
jgi:hypothetical protein